MNNCTGNFGSGERELDRKPIRRTMLLLATLLFVSAAQFGFGQEATVPAEPAELVSLRDSWRSANDRDIKPIKEKYLTTLLSLEEQLTKQERLGSALKVREEIEALTQGTESALDDEDARGADRLAVARGTYDRELARVLEPNRRKYLTALSAMKRKFAQGGSLDAALAVEAELKKVEGADPEEIRKRKKPSARAVRFQNHSYLLVEVRMNFEDAKAHCEKLGGHLVTITSQAEHDFVVKLVVDKGQKDCWLGLTRDQTDDTWHWVTGEEWDYTNWWPTAPNNGDGVEHNVEINEEFEYRWNDIRGSDLVAFVCEWDY